MSFYVTAQTKRNNIKPVLFGIALVMVVMFGLLATDNTSTIRYCGEFTRGYGVIDCACRLVFLGVSFSAHDISAARGEFSLLGRAIFFDIALMNCFAIVTTPIFSKALFTTRVQPVRPTSIGIELAGRFVFPATATNSMSGRVKIVTFLSFGSQFSLVLAFAHFATPLQAIVSLAVLSELIRRFNFFALGTLFRFHHIISKRKALTRFLQIVCLGQSAPGQGDSTNDDDCKLDYPKRLYYTTVAQLAQGM